MERISEFVEVLATTGLLEAEQLDQVKQGWHKAFAHGRALAKALVHQRWLTVYQVNDLFQRYVLLTAGDLVEVVRANHLLQPEQLTHLTQGLHACFAEPRALAKHLVRLGWLTVYQVNELFAGRGSELAVGPYRILDPLGEGGFSQVFQAWHAEKKCTVALKVVRPDLVANPEALQQFEREVRAISQLEHPNVIRTLDENVAGDVHYLAMEYVEGTTLGKLVHLGGPLPVAAACDYARQVALGLQHAHERCLVHRDIKPDNLLRVAAPAPDDGSPPPLLGGQIKILDWGLAGLRLPVETQAAVDTLAPEGTMGTADYLSPEQALDIRHADTRSDIYSLGCTLYFLLTGQPPFPDGSLMQKLFRHQQADPTPVQLLRPEVPVLLAQVLARMLAKQPDKRYQTPAAVAAALALFCSATRRRASPTLLMKMPAPAERDGS